MSKDKRKNEGDPLSAFLNSTLQAGEGQAAFYCIEHGKHIVTLMGLENMVRPRCIMCRREMLSEAENTSKEDLRKFRKQRSNILRSHLEGDTQRGI